MSDSLYSKAGVNIDKGNQAVDNIKRMVKKMGVAEIGKFSGFFPLNGALKNPTLVSSADGVGTKLKIAFMMEKHDTIGKDLVNHCVDDIIVYGSTPLFFLDYIATGNLEPDTVTSIVSGMLNGCLDNNFVLLGGETAEMPGFYRDKEYDVAGFIVGLIDKERIIDGKNIKEGDLLIGLPSNGLHTNGYSLARHIAFEKMKLKIDSKVEGLELTIGEELLKTHISYLKPVRTLHNKDLIKGIAHITGGGFIENIPRILPDGFGVKIEKVWPVPEIFKFLVEAGKISEEERYRVFNMGIGMIFVIDKKNLSEVEKNLTEINQEYYLIGQVTKETGKKRIKVK
jgi:phosphoribosylformylglycinamidine cyclo-ligase